MKNLGIKKHFTLILNGPDEVELRHGVWNSTSFALKDDSGRGFLSKILTSLDGRLSPAEIANQIGCSRKDVETVVDHLDQLSVLQSGPQSALDYYLDNLAPTIVGTEPPPVRNVVLLGAQTLTEPIRDILSSSESPVEISNESIPAIVYANGGEWQYDGLQFTQMIQEFEKYKDSLVVGAFSSIDTLAFQALNRASLEFGFPWLHVAFDGPMLIVGPMFCTPKGPCYECFEKRVSMNLKNHASYVKYKNAITEQRVQFGEIPIDKILANIVASHAALEIMNFLQTDYSFVFGKALCIFIPTMEFSYNEVLRLPGCPACGSIAELDDVELYFDMRRLFNVETIGK